MNLSVYVVRQLMRQEAPSLLWITMHDIDIAHAGAYSLYIDGIRRTDRLCAEVWKAIQSEPEYAGKTTMFILAGFRPRLGRRFRRQRISAPSHRRRAFAYDLDDGAGRGCA